MFFPTKRFKFYYSHIIITFIIASILSGCSSAPVQRTESYFRNLYKRLEYRQEGRYRVVDIFYATSREVTGEGEDLKFLPRMAEKMTEGTVEIKIDPSIRIGKMLPKRFKRKGKLGIQDIRKLSDEDFIKKLTETVKASPHKSLLVVIFGFKDDFHAVAMEAAYFAYMLDVNTPILLFDWPGDQPVSISGYERAQKYARESGPYLGELLNSVVRKVKPERIWIQASSMGCQVVCDAFEYMYEHDDMRDEQAEIHNVFMAAPDVGEDEFDHKFKAEIAALSHHLTTYVSSNDTALLVSGIINDDKRLGRKNIKKLSQDQQEEAKDILYIRSLHPDKVALVDVTPINKASYGHGYYLEDPTYFDDLYLRMRGKRPHVNRRLYLLKYKGETDYWVLK